jgi:hypothetical protein
MISYSVIITSLGASRMYRGITGYHPTNILPVIEIGGKEGSELVAGPHMRATSPRITLDLRSIPTDSDALPDSHTPAGLESNKMTNFGADVA